MILMLKFKPEQSKILMISRKKVFRVFDGQPTLLHRNGHVGGEPSRRATEWCVESGGSSIVVCEISAFSFQ
jgi:hypothetical protein